MFFWVLQQKKSPIRALFVEFIVIDNGSMSDRFGDLHDQFGQHVPRF